MKPKCLGQRLRMLAPLEPLADKSLARKLQPRRAGLVRDRGEAHKKTTWCDRNKQIVSDS